MLIQNASKSARSTTSFHPEYSSFSRSVNISFISPIVSKSSSVIERPSCLHLRRKKRSCHRAVVSGLYGILNQLLYTASVVLLVVFFFTRPVGKGVAFSDGFSVLTSVLSSVVADSVAVHQLMSSEAPAFRISPSIFM